MIKVNQFPIKYIECPKSTMGIYVVKQGDNFYAIKNGDMTLSNQNLCFDEKCKKFERKLIAGKSTVVSYAFMSLVEGGTKILQTKLTKTWEKNLKIYCNKVRGEKVVVKVHTTGGEGCILEIVYATKTSNGNIQLEVKPILWL